MTSADALALLIFIVLTIVAVFHVYWGFGGRWPGHDERSLARMVVGSKGITRMPGRGLTLVVAVLIFAAGAMAIICGPLFSSSLPAIWRSAATTGLALVFGVRGIAGFTPLFRRLEAEEPFVTLDRRFYSPLCLALGGGFAVLSVV